MSGREEGEVRHTPVVLSLFDKSAFLFVVLVSYIINESSLITVIYFEQFA